MDEVVVGFEMGWGNLHINAACAFVVDIFSRRHDMIESSFPFARVVDPSEIYVVGMLMRDDRY